MTPSTVGRMLLHLSLLFYVRKRLNIVFTELMIVKLQMH